MLKLGLLFWALFPAYGGSVEYPCTIYLSAPGALYFSPAQAHIAHETLWRLRAEILELIEGSSVGKPVRVAPEWEVSEYFAHLESSIDQLSVLYYGLGYLSDLIDHTLAFRERALGSELSPIGSTQAGFILENLEYRSEAPLWDRSTRQAALAASLVQPLETKAQPWQLRGWISRHLEITKFYKIPLSGHLLAYEWSMEKFYSLDKTPAIR